MSDELERAESQIRGLREEATYYRVRSRSLERILGEALPYLPPCPRDGTCRCVTHDARHALRNADQGKG